MNYFANKQALSDRAVFITKNRAEEYADEIQNSIHHTLLFKEDSILKSGVLSRAGIQPSKPEMSVVQADSVSTIFKYTTDNERVAVLNFASYKHPGGMFMTGSSAQEESLCHASVLYNVLSSDELAYYYIENNKTKNRGLYTDRALYSESVVFFDNTANADKIGEMRLIDVITCAAPNASCFLKYNTSDGAKALNDHMLASRILFLHDICEYAAIVFNLETVVLGAWGCGVFGQDPKLVANLMVETFQSTRLNRVIFGIPDDRTYETFRLTVMRSSISDLK